MSHFFSAIKISALALVFLPRAWATQVTETPSEVSRTLIPFDEYKEVILVRSVIAPTSAEHPASIKATNKIDEILENRIRGILNNVKVVSSDELSSISFSGKQEKDVLLIKPYYLQTNKEYTWGWDLRRQEADAERIGMYLQRVSYPGVFFISLWLVY